MEIALRKLLDQLFDVFMGVITNLEDVVLASSIVIDSLSMM